MPRSCSCHGESQWIYTWFIHHLSSVNIYSSAPTGKELNFGIGKAPAECQLTRKCSNSGWLLYEFLCRLSFIWFTQACAVTQSPYFSDRQAPSDDLRCNDALEKTCAASRASQSNFSCYFCGGNERHKRVKRCAEDVMCCNCSK